MQLLSMHVDTVRALQRLHIPFDDLTPDGLWGTPYHLIGVSADQRDVLSAWGVAYDEVTPAVFQRIGLGTAAVGGGGGGSNGSRGSSPTLGSRIDTRSEPRAEYRPEPRVESRAEPAAGPAAPAAQPPAQAAAPAAAAPAAPQPAAAQSTPPSPPAAAAPQPSATVATPSAASKPGASRSATPVSGATSVSAAEDPLRDGTRLRTSYRGRYREATVRGGKILLDGRAFDSLTQASSSISADKNDWEFWEFFDDGAGKWRMLDREWQA